MIIVVNMVLVIKNEASLVAHSLTSPTARHTTDGGKGIRFLKGEQPWPKPHKPKCKASHQEVPMCPPLTRAVR